jgi:hypothetical protein
MTDDLLEIPPFLRRTEPEKVRPAARVRPRTLKLPKSASRKRKKLPGHPGALRALGYRPKAIRELSRREAEEIVARRVRA